MRSRHSDPHPSTGDRWCAAQTPRHAIWRRGRAAGMCHCQLCAHTVAQPGASPPPAHACAPASQPAKQSPARPACHPQVALPLGDAGAVSACSSPGQAQSHLPERPCLPPHPCSQAHGCCQSQQGPPPSAASSTGLPSAEVAGCAPVPSHRKPTSAGTCLIHSACSVSLTAYDVREWRERGREGGNYYNGGNFQEG